MKKTIKKVLATMLVAVMLLSAAPLSGIADYDWGSFFATKAAAEESTDVCYTDGYYTYTVSDGNATITNVDTSISGDIEIPSTLGGYPVTGIGGAAFCYCDDLVNVTIPDSVTSIGDFAFWGCTELISVTIGSGVTSIEYDIFGGCTKLKNIKVDEDNTLCDSRNNCNAIIDTETNTLFWDVKPRLFPIV